jgi:hypothetical protein
MVCNRDDWHDCHPLLCDDLERIERSLAASPEPDPERTTLVSGGTSDTFAAAYGIDSRRRAPLPPIPRKLMRDPFDGGGRRKEGEKNESAKPKLTIRYEGRESARGVFRVVQVTTG